MKNIDLIIHPDRIMMDIHPNETVLHAIRRNRPGIYLESPCNGKGYCGKCKVKLLSGHVQPVSAQEQKHLSPEDLKNNIRLACCLIPIGESEPIVIQLIEKDEKPAEVLSNYTLPEYSLNPLIQKIWYPEIGKTSYLCRGVETAFVYGDWTAYSYGVAVDIGTTTVASTLLDLHTGQVLAKASSVNPQTVIGGDVLSRIEYTMTNENGLAELQSLILNRLNELTAELIEKAGIQKEYVDCFSIAANCTMLHLLLGVNPESIAMAPYKPVFTKEHIIKASQIGLTSGSEQAMFYCLPSVSAYVGADITAGIKITKIYEAKKNVMFIDIGTNGEIVLSLNGKLSACSCAAGPALEGMNITCGMRAAKGAIEHINYTGDSFKVQTINNVPPIGICGSGVLEAMAALLDAGIVEPSGRISKNLSKHQESFVIREGKSTSVKIVDNEKPIVFSQNDIRQVQLAKGAILSGFTALMKAKNLDLDVLDEVIIAGQFGSYLNEETLIKTGILPESARGKVRYIGNSSLSGAILCLLDQVASMELNQLATNIDYFELAMFPGYTDLLMKCLKFPDSGNVSSWHQHQN